jgi:hypothetical protein
MPTILPLRSKTGAPESTTLFVPRISIIEARKAAENRGQIQTTNYKTTLKHSQFHNACLLSITTEYKDRTVAAIHDIKVTAQARAAS